MTFHFGAEPLVTALKKSPFELTAMKAHEAALDFHSHSKAHLAMPFCSPISVRIRSCFPTSDPLSSPHRESTTALDSYSNIHLNIDISQQAVAPQVAERNGRDLDRGEAAG